MAQFRWEQDNDNLSGFSRPDYVFQGIWNYANDAPVFESLATNPTTGSVANGQRYFRDHNIAAFVQHDWKATQNLTINTGLRWEYFEPLYNKGFGINQPVFGPTATNFLTAARLTPVNHLTNSNYNNWGPKIGFAWSPNTANNKMVVSGGFGVSYDRIDDGLFTNNFENGPGYAQFGLCCGTDAPPPPKRASFLSTEAHAPPSVIRQTPRSPSEPIQPLACPTDNRRSKSTVLHPTPRSLSSITSPGRFNTSCPIKWWPRSSIRARSGITSSASSTKTSYTRPVPLLPRTAPVPQPQF